MTTENDFKVIENEQDRVNPYGDRIVIQPKLKNVKTGEVVEEMSVGLSRHQVENYDIDERIKRYKNRLIAQMEAKK